MDSLNVETQHYIGDYVILLDKVYEVVELCINIYYDGIDKKDKYEVTYDLSDICDVNNFEFVIYEEELKPASQEEVDLYIDQNNKEVNNIDDFKVFLDEKINSKFEEPERTVDYILDEYLDYQELIRVFGDDEGNYESKLNELVEELTIKTNKIVDNK